MKLYMLHKTQGLPIALGLAWAFFSDPRNLALITPPSLNLIPIDDVPARMYDGMVVSYRVKLFPGFSATWVTEITHVKEPHYFVDEQRFGPYRFWHHQHHFRAIPNGTEASDLIHYALPFDPLSRLVHGSIVRRQLESIFRFRRQVLTERFGEFL